MMTNAQRNYYRTGDEGNDERRRLVALGRQIPTMTWEEMEREARWMNWDVRTNRLGPSLIVTVVGRFPHGDFDEWRTEGPPETRDDLLRAGLTVVVKRALSSLNW